MKSYLPETRTIASGVTLTSIKTTDFKTDYIAFNFVNRLSERANPANALLPELLIAGNAEYKSNLELNRALDMLYDTDLNQIPSWVSGLNIHTYSTTPLCSVFTPDKTDVLGGALGIIASLLCRPEVENLGLNRRHFESRKEKAVAAIASKINNKRIYAADRLQEEMYRGQIDGYPVSGTAEQVNALTPEDLYETYLNNKKYSRVEIFHAGRTDIDELAERICCLFSSADRTEYTELKDNFVIKDRADEIKYFEEEHPVQQGILCVGFRTGGIRYDHPLYPAFLIFNELYGGSPTSRLFANVREKSHLCYYCISRPNTTTATLTVQSGIENENREKTEEQILFWLEDLKKGNVGIEETEQAKLSIKNALLSANESRSSLGIFYLNRTLLGKSEGPFDLFAKVEKVTPEDVAKVAGMVTPDTVFFLRGGAK